VRNINVNGAIEPTNPLYEADDLAVQCTVSIENSSAAVKALVIDLMADHSLLKRNPEAFAVLHGALLSIVPLLSKFSRAGADDQARASGAIDFIWAYACDAYTYACDLLGDDADRLHPVAYAHVIAAYYRAMVERMRLETSGPYEVLH
jgi:hypothetical protein